MNTINTSLRLTTIDRWLAPHSAALVTFADTDHLFALTLAEIIQEENWSVLDGPTIKASAHLAPLDYLAAEDILDWLLYELVTHPEARVSRSLLVIWAHNFLSSSDSTTKNETIALVAPTQANTKAVRKNSQLQIVTEKIWQESMPVASFVEKTHAMSQELLAVELRKAGGKIGSLHPHTAEWCMGGAATKFYNAKLDTLDTLHKTAMNENLNHQIVTKEQKIVAIAISPAVNDLLVEKVVS